MCNHAESRIFPLLCHCFFFLFDCRAHEAVKYGNNSMSVWVEKRRDKNKRRQDIRRPSSKGEGGKMKVD